VWCFVGVTIEGKPRVNSHVLYYQSQGSWGGQHEPVLLCVGPLGRCEAMRESLLKNPEFTVILSRERGGALQITPIAKGPSIVSRSVAFQNSISAVGGVNRI
jgi:hypothetical protein